MNIKPSPLVSQLRGSAGPITVATLHGRPYLKRRSPPRVTLKPKQVRQRHRVKAVSAWHPEFPLLVRAHIDSLNAGLEHSLINAFITQQLRDLAAYNEPRILRHTSPIAPVASIAAYNRPEDYYLNVIWEPGDAEPLYKPYLFYAEPHNDTSIPLHILGFIISPFTIAKGYTVFDMPKMTTLYWVALLVKHPTLPLWSAARTDWAISGPS